MSSPPCHLLPPPCPPRWSGRWTTPWSSHSRQASATKTGRLVPSGLECWQEPALDGRTPQASTLTAPAHACAIFKDVSSHNQFHVAEPLIVPEFFSFGLLKGKLLAEIPSILPQVSEKMKCYWRFWGKQCNWGLCYRGLKCNNNIQPHTLLELDPLCPSGSRVP